MAVRTQEQLVEAISSRLVPEGDCLVWPGATFQAGYGLIHHDGRHKSVHRTLWEATYGDLEQTVVVDHKCHNRLCANLEHLRAVTRKQNGENRKGANKNNSCGSRNVIRRQRGNSLRFYVRLRHAGKDYGFGGYGSLAEAEAVAREKRLQLFSNNNPADNDKG